jgi:hypothetical protein
VDKVERAVNEDSLVQISVHHRQAGALVVCALERLDVLAVLLEIIFQIRYTPIRAVVAAEAVPYVEQRLCDRGEFFVLTSKFIDEFRLCGSICFLVDGSQQHVVFLAGAGVFFHL